MANKYREVKIVIVAKIPMKSFTYESQNCFIRSVLALFHGMFPSTLEVSRDSVDDPPVTVTINDIEEKP